MWGKMRLFIQKIAAVAVFYLITVVASTSQTHSCQKRAYQVVFGYKQVDYQFPSAEVREELINSGEFIPENNVFIGIKIFGERIFLAVPRWRLGVPSTFNFIKLRDSGNQKGDGKNGGAPAAPPLVPYPSWEMQKIGNCSALQNSQSMEIDEFGRLWVFDTGRINVFAQDPAEQRNLCPAKLVIFDLATDKILLNYQFPSEVVSPTNNFLDDIAVGCESFKNRENDKSNCWAYLSETSEGKIVIFSLKQKRSWFVRHQTMDSDPEAVLGITYSQPVLGNIDGITLSPKDSNHDRVYYNPLNSYAKYSVSSVLLQSSKNGCILKDSDITVHITNQSSQSGGMIMDSEGTLFYNVLQNNSVACVNTQKSDGFSKETEVIQSDKDLQLPDSFAFDNQGYLYTNAVRTQRFQTNTLDWNDINFRIVRAFVGSRSYVYSSSYH